MTEKSVRKCVSRTGRDIFLYSLIAAAVISAAMIARTVWFLVQAEDLALTDQVLEELMKRVDSQIGVYSILGLSAGLLFLWFRCWRLGILNQILKVQRRIQGKRAMELFCVFMAGQAVFFAVSLVSESVLNLFGLTLLEEIQGASEVSTTLSAFLYGSVAAPVAEELIFRGFVLRSILPCGKGLAIVVSSVLFGVMHGNFVQGVFAMFIGLVLGYIACEYSIQWAILFHVLNNMVFGDLMGKLVIYLPKAVQGALNYAIMGVFFAAAAVILHRRRGKIKDWWIENRPAKGEFIQAFTAFWVILFFLMQLISALNGIKSI